MSFTEGSKFQERAEDERRNPKIGYGRGDDNMNLGPAPGLPESKTFGWALEQATEGKRIARRSWSKDHWVCYMPPTMIHQDHVNTRTRKFIPEGPLNVQGYFVVYTKTPDAPNSVSSEGTYGRWQPGWVPSTEDTLATDWTTLD